MTQITVGLADDHAITRQGLRELLSHEDAICVVGEAATGMQTIELAGTLKPDVLVLDMCMPDLDGVAVLEQLAAIGCPTRAVILSMTSGEYDVIRALAAGAMGYVRKESNLDHLVTAIRAAVQGRRYLCPVLAERALARYSGNADVTAYASKGVPTGQETKVLTLAAKGLTNAAIAHHLSISPRTVETHRAKAMKKLALRNHTDLVLYAIKSGMLSTS